MCNVLVADRRVVTPSAGMREHAATDWSWRGSGPGSLLIVRVSPAGGAVKVVRPVGRCTLTAPAVGEATQRSGGWAD
jgi:hypothetical protein